MLEVTTKEGVLTITFDRPDKFNAFNRELALGVQEALRLAATDAKVRCVVITGAGKAFCAGQDLGEAIAEDGPTLRDIVAKHYNPIIKAIRELPKPVIAAVNGVAAGAGANIALACDIVVATESASFVQAFSKIGLIPDSGGTFILPRLIGIQKAAALMMTGEPVLAKDAENMGMIYKYYTDDSFETESWKLVSKLAKMPTKGLGLTKRLLNASSSNDLENQLNMEDECQVIAAETADFKEGVQAFLEKRKPNFKGE